MKKALLANSVLLGFLLAACSQSTVINAVPTRSSQAVHSYAVRGNAICPCYQLLHSFGSTGQDGTEPTGDLSLLNGVLYGITYGGGSAGFGTVYSITEAGAEQILYNFRGTPDGRSPASGLLYSNGAFYGTTQSGGLADWGTVFSLTPGRTENVLHSFRAPKARNPSYATLASVNGTFYGETNIGGKYQQGLVFSVTPSGTVTILHNFGDHAGDGTSPSGGLIAINGVLYGTTSGGGTSGKGTLFSITTSGAETVLHSFAGGADGTTPLSRPAYFQGALYGTTAGTAGSNAGIIYRMMIGGAETVLHIFRSTGGPASPIGAGLTPMNGMLYGMTSAGGKYNKGTIYRVTANGAVTVLHDFAGSPTDAEHPEFSYLYPLNGTLYGTSYVGGASGNGAFFSIKP